MCMGQPLAIDVPVLRNDGGDALRVPHGYAKADGSSVVKHIQGKSLESNGLGEAVYNLSQMLKRVVNKLGCRAEDSFQLAIHLVGDGLQPFV